MLVIWKMLRDLWFLNAFDGAVRSTSDTEIWKCSMHGSNIAVTFGAHVSRPFPLRAKNMSCLTLGVDRFYGRPDKCESPRG